MRNISVRLRKCSLKILLVLALLAFSFIRAIQFVIFFRGHYKEHYLTILNFCLWIRRSCLNIISIFSICSSHFV